VNEFVAQAKQVDQWDRELIVQRDRALRLQQQTSMLSQGADAISSELELILHHQDEMHAALSELERKVEEEGRSFHDRPGERQQAYALVESLDRELADTRSLLTDTIKQVNASSPAEDASGGSGTQLSQLVQVLDSHLSAFQWLDANSNQLEQQLSRADTMLSGFPR